MIQLRLRSPIYRRQAAPVRLSPRYAVTVTGHAIEKAKERYPGDWNGPEILADIAEAIQEGRVADRIPHARGRKVRDGLLAWTLDGGRVYVLRLETRCPGYVVLTALPPIVARDQQLHRTGLTAVGAALAAAGITGGAT
jgi:hypothetical protein